MRKISLLLMVSLLLILFLSTNAFSEEGKLTLLLSRGGSGETLSNSAEHFQEKTGIEMEVLFFPYDELRNKQILALSQGRSTPDIIAVDDIWFAQMWNYLEPLQLEDEKIDSFINPMIETFRWPRNEGPYRAVPVRMGGDVIMYREDVLKESGINPSDIKTWEDFLQSAKDLTIPNERQWGYAQGFSPQAYLVTQWINILRSYGADMFTSDNKKAAFNTEAGIKATKILVDLATEASPPGVISYGYWDQVEAMQTGMVVLSMVWNPRFQSVNDPEYPHSGQFKVLPHFPGGQGFRQEGIPGVYGWGLGINENSENKEQAKQFLEFITSDEEQLRLATDFANSPTVESVFNNSTYLETIPEAKNMVEALENGASRPVHVNYVQIQDAIGLELHQAILGEKTVEEALDSAENAVNEIMSE